MIKNSYINFFLILLVGFMSACSTKKAQKTSGNFKKKSPSELLAKMEQNRIDFTTFSTKAKITIVEGNDTRSADARIRMKRDSAIWFSISLFGIEGARALLTPDSIKVLNRLDGTYIAEGYNYFQHRYNVPLTFYSLQDLIVGNPTDRDAIGFSTTTDSTNYILSKGIDGSVMSYYIDPTSFLMNKMSIEELREQRFFRQILSNYEAVEDMPTTRIATARAIMSRTEQGDFKIGMELLKIRLNQPIDMEFVIPEGYKQTKM